jgi:hypothetical protein
MRTTSVELLLSLHLQPDNDPTVPKCGVNRAPGTGNTKSNLTDSDSSKFNIANQAKCCVAELLRRMYDYSRHDSTRYYPPPHTSHLTEYILCRLLCHCESSSFACSTGTNYWRCCCLKEQCWWPPALPHHSNKRSNATVLYYIKYPNIVHEIM